VSLPGTTITSLKRRDMDIIFSRFKVRALKMTATAVSESLEQ